MQGAPTSGAALASDLFAWSLPLGFPGLPFLAAGVFAAAGAALLALTRPPVTTVIDSPVS